jgi:hypothetical protein
MPWLPSFNYDTLMKDKEMRALTTDELIYLIQYDPMKKQRNTSKTDKDTTLINALKSHYTNEMKSFINPTKAREYLEAYTEKRAELENELNKLSQSEMRKNNRRQMMANIHGNNSEEEVDESEGATGYRKGEQKVKEQIKALDADMKNYFISENNASLAELKRFYNLQALHGGKRGRTHRRRKSKTRRSKKARYLTRHRR